MRTLSAPAPISDGGAIQTGPSEAKAVIGPNAATQLLGVLGAEADAESVERIVAAAGVTDWRTHPPDHMVDERPVIALHRATRAVLGADRGGSLLAEAGLRTGDYILANRIPRAARLALKILPARISARLLARAITAHAWTFVGSGRFVCARADGLEFEIWGNPFCAGEATAAPNCVWHAAVFTRLYQALVSPKAIAVETECLARGDACCRFAIRGLGN